MMPSHGEAEAAVARPTTDYPLDQKKDYQNVLIGTLRLHYAVDAYDGTLCKSPVYIWVSFVLSSLFELSRRHSCICSRTLWYLPVYTWVFFRSFVAFLCVKHRAYACWHQLSDLGFLRSFIDFTGVLACVSRSCQKRDILAALSAS